MSAWRRQERARGEATAQTDRSRRARTEEIALARAFSLARASLMEIDKNMFVRAAWLVCIALMVCAQFSSYSGCPVVVPTGFRTVSPSLSAAFGGRDFGSVRYEPGAYFCVAGVVFGKKASAALLNCMNRFRAKRGERFISLAQRESIKV